MSYLTNVSAFLPLRISPVILSLKLKVRGRQLMEKKKWTEGRALGKTGLHPWLCVPGLSHGRLLLTQDLLTFDPLSKHLEGKPHKMYTCREKKKKKRKVRALTDSMLCAYIMEAFSLCWELGMNSHSFWYSPVTPSSRHRLVTQLPPWHCGTPMSPLMSAEHLKMHHG